MATLNTEEEFEAVHKFAYGCERWSDRRFLYHVGLYVYKNERFYTDCTEWDWAEHSKLYVEDRGKGPCWNAVYRPLTKEQKIYSNIYCYDDKHRTICFNAFDNATTKAEGIATDNVGFDSFNVLTFLFAAVAIGFAIVSMKKKKMYEKELSEIKREISL